MQKNIFFHYLSLLCCIAIVAVCFMPWVHYNNINETFTGFHVRRFVTGNYYGRAGIIVCALVAIVFLCTLLPYRFGKRVSLFVAAVLVAYSISKYTIFTSALFPDEIIIYPAIKLLVALSFVLLVAVAFPKKSNKDMQENNAV